MNLPPKALKILALALDNAAADGEWRNAAVMFVGILRREGTTLDSFADEPPPPQYHHRRPFDPPPPRRTQFYPVRMPFGKHMGEPLADLPDDYLRWLTTRVLKPKLHAAVQAEMERRR